MNLKIELHVDDIKAGDKHETIKSLVFEAMLDIDFSSSVQQRIPIKLRNCREIGYILVG
jgi:hypothetical protein